MSLTALVWFACYLGLLALSFKRPVWAVSLYLLTFYATPHFWWWGGPIVGVFGNRVNLITALVLAAVVLINPTGESRSLSPLQRRILLLVLLYAVNATIVHFAFAEDEPHSFVGLQMIWKQLGLLYLMMLALRTKLDWKILMWSIILGSFYIAYEVVVNKRGYGGRLEHIGVPNADGSNQLAGFIGFTFPLLGFCFFFGTRWQRLFSVVGLAWVFEVILQCNSRGGFLALIAQGTWLLLASRGRVRRYALYSIALGLLAIPLMVRDQAIMDRFGSTFVSSEERDQSAASRLDYWSAASRMIAGHPLGLGFEAAFDSPTGMNYLEQQTGWHHERSVHNGYLDTAASWGVQGLALYLLPLLLCWWHAGKTSRLAARRGDPRAEFLGLCVQTMLVGISVSSVFGSTLDAEWYFWYMALAASYAELYAPERAVSAAGEHAWSSTAVEGRPLPLDSVGLT